MQLHFDEKQDLQKGVPVNRVSDNVLTKRIEILARKERELLHYVIIHIAEFDRRRLYLHLGYTSLFEYMTKHLKYSAGSAQRRIDAARLSRELPEVVQKIESGDLQLSQLSVLQKGIRRSQKESFKAPQELVQAKRQILSKIENKSFEQTESIVAKELDLKVVVKETITTQADDSKRVELTLSAEQMKKLEKCKELLSHTNPSASWAEVIEAMADQYIQKKDPAAPKRKRTSLPMGSDNIPAAVKRAVFQRDQCCQFKNPQSGAKCGSRFQLQVDHIIPRWAGGTNEIKNLQLLCAQHNRWKYQRESGIRIYKH